MDAIRDDHTKWSKSKRQKQMNIIWYNLYVEPKIQQKK